MKKLVVLFLVAVISFVSVGCAEQASTVCSCLCCQDTLITNDETDSQPLTYEEWLDFAFPLLKNCYNLSTWVAANNVTVYNPGSEPAWAYVDASFLLLDDIRCANDEQIEIINQIITSNSHRDSNKIINTYKFIQHAPSICNTLRIARSGMNVPEEYTVIDGMMMNVIEQLEGMQSSIVAHITENGTTENWVGVTPGLNSDMEKIELLYTFID